MSARRNYQRQHPRRITVRGVRLSQPDLHKLGRVLIALAEAQAEKDAEQQAPRRGQSNADKEASDGES